MPLGTLQAFIQNMQQGQANARTAQDWRQKQQALQALGMMFGQDGSPRPQPPTQPTAAPAPAPSGPPIALNPQSAAQAGPQGLAALAGINKDGGQNPPMGGPAPAPGGAPATPPPDPSLSATAQPQQPAFDDPIAGASQNIKALAASIKAANPKIDPKTLASAVEMQIENIKGVAPLTKAAMTAQIQMVKAQQDWQYKQQRLTQLDEGLRIRLQQAKTAEERVQAMTEYNEQRIAVMREGIAERAEASAESSGARIKAAEIGANSRETVAGMNVAGRADVAGQNNEARGRTAVERTFSSAYNAAINAGKSPTDAVKAGNAAVQGAASRVPQRAPTAAPSGQRGAAKGPVRVNTPSDVKRLPKGTRWISADGSHSGTT